MTDSDTLVTLTLVTLSSLTVNSLQTAHVCQTRRLTETALSTALRTFDFVPSKFQDGASLMMAG